jgi:hypothetical protein
MATKEFREAAAKTKRGVYFLARACCDRSECIDHARPSWKNKGGWHAVNYGSIPFLVLAASATLWLR